jgi:hypothetical protein
MKRFAFVLLLVFGVAPVLCGQAPKPNADTPKEGAEPGKRLDEYIEEYKQKSSAALAGAQPAPKNNFGSEVRPEGELFVIMDKLQQFDEPSRAKVLASFNEYLDYRISATSIGGKFLSGSSSRRRSPFTSLSCSCWREFTFPAFNFIVHSTRSARR